MPTASRILIVEDQEVLGENLKTYTGAAPAIPSLIRDLASTGLNVDVAAGRAAQMP